MFLGMYNNLSGATVTLLSLFVILVAGFLLTRLSKLLKLPNVSGYIVAGVLIGPHVLGFVPVAITESMDFVSDIALAFIAFGVGRFFKREVLQRTGFGVVVITLFESLFAGLLITLMMRFVFDTGWNFALLIGAIATATAPASTMMTIRQYRARGNFVDTLLQVVALDDVVALLAFGVASAVAQASGTGVVNLSSVALPIAYNLAGIALGFGCAHLLKALMHEGRSTDNRLILLIAMLLGLCALCSMLDISPLLCCMVLGAVYVNRTGDETLFEQLDGFTPPVLSCFFVLSGMRLDLGALQSAGIVGIAYFVVRIIGKYIGSYLGCTLAKSEENVKRYLGLALVPQAGVSIGLAFLGQRILPPEMGALLSTIILSSSILYELIGPACAKLSLFLSGAIQREHASAPAKAHRHLGARHADAVAAHAKQHMR
ncbi:cation:proton antiporter [Eubacteriales bacterium OttesenSCG-928-N14]|nr:cation:proton antiporter [Eubacteriales bacterium OttesenSCG-928-N14]